MQYACKLSIQNTGNDCRKPHWFNYTINGQKSVNQSQKIKMLWKMVIGK